MQVAHQRFEPFFQHVRIDLRRRYIGVPEQRLHHAQVGAVVQQVAGEGVTQHMRAQPFRGDAAARPKRLQFAGEMLAGEVAMLAEGREQPFRRRLRLGLAAQRQVIGHGALRRRIERHQPLLAALAAHDEHSLVALGGRGGQCHQFGHAQAGGVDHFDQAIEPRRAQPRGRRERRIVGRPLCRLQKSVDLGDRQHLGQSAPALGSFQYRRRIVGAFSLHVEETVKLAQRRQMPRHGGGGEAAFGQRAEITAQILGARIGDAAAAAAQMRGKIGEVAAIGIERIPAGAPLRRQHVEKQRDRRIVGPGRTLLAGPAGHRASAAA